MILQNILGNDTAVNEIQIYDYFIYLKLHF